MSHRRLQDEDGRWWDVWDTRPTIIDRRAGRERRADGRRIAKDRRQKSEPRVTVEPQYRKGWLAFQSGPEWRRLAPIPEGWASMTARDLLELLSRAAAGESQHTR
ncbi:MAG TPA: hypothetical protein VH080_04650 [Gemmatimonadaceae bacterium]|nr:hypothetical protein [Gemmatimonadaceae bacterium]